MELVLANHNVEVLSCLDLGTGTGAIALALASEHKNWHVHAVDFNQDAVALAKINAQKNTLTQVIIYQSDWFSNLCKTQRFDIIVSNPPYIDEHDHHLSEGDVRFEPLSALVAPQQGYADIIHIVASARAYFNKQGYLYIEHGFEQAEKVQAIFREYGYQQIQTQQDLSGNDRITFGQYYCQ